MKRSTWLELLVKAELFEICDLEKLIQECSEIVAILTTICKKIKEQNKK